MRNQWRREVRHVIEAPGHYSGSNFFFIRLSPGCQEVKQSHNTPTPTQLSLWPSARPALNYL